MARVICPAPGVQLTLQSWTGESLSPLTMRFQFMPLYGPQKWFDCEPVTLVPPSAAHGPNDLKSNQGEAK